MYCKQYCEDLKRIADNYHFEQMEGSRILVTGATGLIGSAVADVLLFLKLYKGYNIHIIAGCRNREKFEKRFKEYGSNFKFVRYDACETIQFREPVDYIIHTAGNAHPKLYAKEPVETILSNIEGIFHLLEYAKKYQAKRLLYISSSEVYGQNENQVSYRECDYGFIDALNARSCYPNSKRTSETLCAAYREEYGVDSVIVRPGHIYGPMLTDTDSRAASQFLRAGANGEAIVMKSAGTQLRSYCHALDCATAILAVLSKGRPGEAYNISNSDSVITIREFAEICAQEAGVELKFEGAAEAERKGYNMMENSALDSKKLEALGWKGLWNSQEGIRESLNVLKHSRLAAEDNTVNL